MAGSILSFACICTSYSIVKVCISCMSIPMVQRRGILLIFSSFSELKVLMCHAWINVSMDNRMQKGIRSVNRRGGCPTASTCWRHCLGDVKVRASVAAASQQAASQLPVQPGPRDQDQEQLRQVRLDLDRRGSAAEQKVGFTLQQDKNQNCQSFLLLQS